MTRAIHLLGPGRVGAGTAADPVPHAGEALLRIRAVGICGSDLHVFTHGHIGTAMATYPFIMGHEAVAEVEGVGDGVPADLVGQRVSIEPTIHCGHCDYCLAGSPNLCVNQSFTSLPPVPGLLRERVAHPVTLLEPVPAGLSDAAGTLLEPMAVSLSALDLLHAKVGQPVVILGCGAIGLTSLLLAREAGLGPIVCAEPVPARREAALELGADAAVGPESVAVAANQWAGPHGFPLVIEASGSDDAQRRMVELAAPGGRIAVIGTNMNDVVAFPGHMARRKGLTVLMVRRSRNTLRRTCHIAKRPDVQARMERLVSHRFGPEEAQRAFEIASTYEDGARKVVLEL